MVAPCIELEVKRSGVKVQARKSRVSDVRMYRRVGRVRVGVGVVECQLYAMCCWRGYALRTLVHIGASR